MPEASRGQDIQAYWNLVRPGLAAQGIDAPVTAPGTVPTVPTVPTVAPVAPVAPKDNEPESDFVPTPEQQAILDAEEQQLAASFPGSQVARDVEAAQQRAYEESEKARTPSPDSHQTISPSSLEFMQEELAIDAAVKRFIDSPYDPSISELSLDAKEAIAQQNNVAYDRNEDLRLNYTQINTNDPANMQWIPNSYFDELKQWADQNQVNYEPLEEALIRGGTRGLNALTKQYAQAIERAAVEKAQAELASWENENLPLMPDDMRDAYERGKESGDFTEYLSVADNYKKKYDEYQSWLDDNIRSDDYLNDILVGSREFNGETGEDAAIAAWEKRQTDIDDIERRKSVRDAVDSELAEGSTPTITPMDISRAEAELYDVIATLADLTPEERGKAIEESEQYKRYMELQRQAEEIPGFGTQRVYDIAREALSFGAVMTPTFNKKEIERQYDQQKEIALATFMNDTSKLKSLFDKGYFGKGDDAVAAYNDSLDVVKQQVALSDAVTAGDTEALKELYEQGAFEGDLDAYTNLVKYVEEGGRELAPVTADDIKAVDEAFGTKDEYVKSVMASMPSLGSLAKDVAIGVVPIWGTIYHWDKMGTGMRGVSIATDALSLIPIVGGISAAAKVSAGVGRGARIASAMKVVPKLVTREVFAPIETVLHPVQTVKAIGSTAKGLVNVLNPRHVPLSTLSTVQGTVRLDLAVLGDPVATMYVRDQLMSLQAAGKKPVVQFGDKVFTLRSGSFLDEGGVVHGSPTIQFVGSEGGFTVATKTYPEGHPKAGQVVRESEQGMFVANTAVERFAYSSAFGFEKGADAVTSNLKVLNNAAEQAKSLGDIKKANKLTKLVDDYNAAIASKSIKALDKAESKIMGKLAEIAEDEIIAKINAARTTAGERFAIGDIKGAQEAMQEALSFEKQLQKTKPGFAIFSPEVNEILVPSGKLYPGMVFQPKAGEFWSIVAGEMKSDKAAQLLKQAQDATRLGDKATAAKLTKEAKDLIKNNKSGFRRVEAAEMELKFPELTQMQQLKPRYTTTASDTGAKLWIYTTEPYSLKKALKAKLKAPIDTLRNIYDPAIRVRTIPMTRSQKLTRIEELLEQAKVADKAGDATQARVLRAEAEVIQQSLTAVKGVTKADNIASAVARAERMDDASELMQAAKRAESVGDYASADRLRRAADAIAGRRYVNAIARRAGTVSGLAEYARALGAMRLDERGVPVGRDIPSRVAGLTERRAGELVRDTSRRPGRLDVRTDRLPPRTPDARVSELRTTRTPDTRRGTDTRRDGREPDSPRTPDTPDTRRGTDTRRDGREPDSPRTPDTPRVPGRNRVPRLLEDDTISMSSVNGEGRRIIPDGSITWAQGAFWKYIPPPWNQNKPITLKKAPAGARNSESNIPAETIQILGNNGRRIRTPRQIAVDLGTVDILVSNYGKRIEFSGKGTETDVGVGVPGNLAGMTVSGDNGNTNTVKYRVSTRKAKKSKRKSTTASLGLVDTRYTEGL